MHPKVDSSAMIITITTLIYITLLCHTVAQVDTENSLCDDDMCALNTLSLSGGEYWEHVLVDMITPHWLINALCCDSHLLQACM